MVPRITSLLPLLATSFWVPALVFAAPVSPTLAPVSGPKAPLVAPAITGLEGAIAALHAHQWARAVEMYTPLVNQKDLHQRAQARYGLALALSQLGQEEKALAVLEGTLRDETPTGKAVGDLRARLVLQLADKAMATGGPTAAAPLLDQYQHLPDQPDSDRFLRLATTGPLPSPTTLTVGVMVPQSGDLKDVGMGIIRGLQLGLKDFATATTPPVNLVFVDAPDATTTAAGAQKLAVQGVDMVVGPLLGYTVGAVRDAFAAKSVPILALTSDRTAVGEGVYALNYLPAEQARAAAQAAVSLGKSRFAILAPKTPYGSEARQAFATEVERLGARVVKQASYNPKEVDIGPSVQTLMRGVAKGQGPDFDALFVPAPGATLPLIMSQLSYYDVDKPGPNGKVLLLGTSQWQSPKVLEPSAGALRGNLFVAPPQTPEFAAAFTETYHVPPHPLSILGYDTARMLTDLAREKQRTGSPVQTLLLRPEGFYGTGGYLRFTPNGVTQRGLATVKVGEQFEVIQDGLKLAPLAR